MANSTDKLTDAYNIIREAETKAAADLQVAAEAYRAALTEIESRFGGPLIQTGGVSFYPGVRMTLNNARLQVEQTINESLNLIPRV